MYVATFQCAALPNFDKGSAGIPKVLMEDRHQIQFGISSKNLWIVVREVRTNLTQLEANNVLRKKSGDS